ncbi:AraC family transcriptional regulator [Alcaligenes sp. SDU_A2]|uniref:AraC family transcriptional regulator n=1 Tax=Alcaligenes sp. SDU_A2 TaxID=3136634 RepID=UPI002B893027|nr:helix-turn-helix transcriptional regulator [Alcaligenes sp.]HRL27458.1 helix-turn-helix transcriptional regulator [Alcaligenes sp.]
MNFDPDSYGCPAFSIKVDIGGCPEEVPLHTHRKGQLIMTQHGAVTFQADDGYWMVPPGCAVWVPGGIRHCNHAAANALIHFLFIEPGAGALPDHCCTLEISPMLREMIMHLSSLERDYPADSSTHRLVQVLLDTLADMPARQLHVPLPEDPTLQHIARQMLAAPHKRISMAQWASHVAMSERTLARHMLKHTGMTFGRWRHQLMMMLALQKLTSGMPVKSTAQELGYGSTSAFIAVFKSILGSTPSRYLHQTPAHLHGQP